MLTNIDTLLDVYGIYPILLLIVKYQQPIIGLRYSTASDVTVSDLNALTWETHSIQWHAHPGVTTRSVCAQYNKPLNWFDPFWAWVTRVHILRVSDYGVTERRRTSRQLFFLPESAQKLTAASHLETAGIRHKQRARASRANRTVKRCDYFPFLSQTGVFYFTGEWVFALFLNA